MSSRRRSWQPSVSGGVVHDTTRCRKERFGSHSTRRLGWHSVVFSLNLAVGEANPAAKSCHTHRNMSTNHPPQFDVSSGCTSPTPFPHVGGYQTEVTCIQSKAAADHPTNPPAVTATGCNPPVQRSPESCVLCPITDGKAHKSSSTRDGTMFGTKYAPECGEQPPPIMGISAIHVSATPQLEHTAHFPQHTPTDTDPSSAGAHPAWTRSKPRRRPPRGPGEATADLRILSASGRWAVPKRWWWGGVGVGPATVRRGRDWPGCCRSGRGETWSASQSRCIQEAVLAMEFLETAKIFKSCAWYGIVLAGGQQVRGVLELSTFSLDVARCTAMSQATADQLPSAAMLVSAAECRGRRQLGCSCWAGRWMQFEKAMPETCSQCARQRHLILSGTNRIKSSSGAVAVSADRASFGLGVE